MRPSTHSSLPGFDRGAQRQFTEQILTSNAWQGLGNLLLLIAVVCTIVTIYKNIMNKNVNKTVMGHEISADRGAIVATDSAAVATDNARINQSSQTIQNFRDHIEHVRNSLDEIDFSERDRKYAAMIVDKLSEHTPGDSGAKQQGASLVEDLVDLVGSATNVADGVVESVKKLRDFFT